ncbi:MAG: flagellar export protein FliJ [Phycisphaerae bacterium]|nr:flagellar export protein FliJ [Phycisphaerae bacterium]
MVKRHTFRLGTVLRLRKMTEDDCRRRVAMQLREIARVESDVRRLEEQFEWETGRSRKDQQNPTMDVMTIRRRRSYMGHLQRRRQECAEQVGTLQEKLSQEQRALADASREVKALEKLRDKQLARQREMELRAQRAEEDEIGRQMFLRFRSVSTE